MKDIILNLVIAVGYWQVQFISVLVFLISSGNYTFAQEEVRLSSLHIDGRDKDWPRLTHYDQDHKIAYGTFIDAEYLYVCLKTDQLVAQKKILLNGMTVWIDVKGRKKKKKGITYPLPAEGISRKSHDKLWSMDAAQSPDERDSEALKEQLNKLHHMVKLQGFGDTKPFVARLDQVNDAMEVAMELDSQNYLIYELKVSFKLIYPKEKANKNRLSVGIETGQINKLEGRSIQPKIGAGGGMRGRSGGISMRVPPSRRKSTLSMQPIKIWSKFAVK